MLQVSTGKFFNTEDMRETIHRGVLYSNFQIRPDGCIATQAGTLSAAARWRDVQTLVCEVIERQPNVWMGGMITSVGPDTFINDFAAVASFALERLFTPDHDLAVRLLTSERPPLGIPRLPRNYVSKTFDMDAPYDREAEARVANLFTDLLSLERKSFSAAMSAIRRYVTALHRLSDDLDLAYTLFVAAIESLVQKFHGTAPVWGDLDQRKRKPIDKALEDAESDVANAVRAAILSGEHVALGRRFREFSLDHVNNQFFRNGAAKSMLPPGKSDLTIALKNAYDIRSGYIHTLKAIPRLLASPHSLAEVMHVDGSPHLTFEGLARVARSVIHEFVRRAPRSKREEFDYQKDFPNLLTMPLAPSMWIHNAANLTADSAYVYLNGFLHEVEQQQLNPSAPVTDIRKVTEKIDNLLPALAKPEQRLPLVTLHYWFSHWLPADERKKAISRLGTFLGDLEGESAEAFFLYVYEGRLPPWPAKTCEDLLDKYFKFRYRDKRLNVGSLLGAAGLLAIAEKFRLAEQDREARRLIARAVEEFPGMARLWEFESRFGEELPPIGWWEVLLPEGVASAESKNMATGKTLSKLNARLRPSAKPRAPLHRRAVPQTRKRG
ncbi:hypothetical protein SAMN05216466_12774 [Paraburkholderia phenazinium]|uniref:Apea-like HEPN domain-containing protein n=1 Tax=Paraburkholderia phenazinium TaxID=60549 RepID=A0A1G8LZ48_9BURK|nr:hypothetical protein [Paraburkholderia phenazinium]SDI13108.1 hypothetical protein SAMN05216466_117165 [Paraburkholderia phenazinium]SDI60430.1 hypothetical protein SAMN05216466_12774 [Paraburkholderia phenazinium]